MYVTLVRWATSSILKRHTQAHESFRWIGWSGRGRLTAPFRPSRGARAAWRPRWTVEAPATRGSYIRHTIIDICFQFHLPKSPIQQPGFLVAWRKQTSSWARALSEHLSPAFWFARGIWLQRHRQVLARTQGLWLYWGERSRPGPGLRRCHGNGNAFDRRCSLKHLTGLSEIAMGDILWTTMKYVDSPFFRDHPSWGTQIQSLYKPRRLLPGCCLHSI